MKTTKYIALVGNIFYFLWILIKGINNGFHAETVLQGVILTVLMLLLILNSVLIWKQRG